MKKNNNIYILSYDYYKSLLYKYKIISIIGLSLLLIAPMCILVFTHWYLVGEILLFLFGLSAVLVLTLPYIIEIYYPHIFVYEDETLGIGRNKIIYTLSNGKLSYEKMINCHNMSDIIYGVLSCRPIYQLFQLKKYISNEYYYSPQPKEGTTINDVIDYLIIRYNIKICFL